MLSDLVDFVVAVFSHWQAWVTGGGVMAILSVWERLSGKSISRRMYINIVIIFFLLVAGFLSWRDERIEKDKLRAELAKAQQVTTGVFMECHMVSLPVTIPPRSTIYVISLNESVQKESHVGFTVIRNDGGEEREWPGRKKLEWNNPGVFGYACEVSNHGPDDILYMWIPLDIWFRDKKPIRYEPIVSSLSRSESFSFFIFNDCPVSPSAVWQDVAKIQTFKRPSTHKVPLRRRYRSPMDQIMMFFPSSVQWLGQRPC